MPDIDEKHAVRTRLLDAAAAILGTRGPEALTLRAVADAANTSTMAVYTHFGSMPALVVAAVGEGYNRLAARLDAVPDTDEPLRDLLRVGLAYIENARANPTMYAIMTGAAPLGKYSLSRDDEEQARSLTHQRLVRAVERAMEAGELASTSAPVLAAQMLAATHGYLLFEARGGLPDDAFGVVLIPMLRSLALAEGADPAVLDRIAESEAGVRVTQKKTDSAVT